MATHKDIKISKPAPAETIICPRCFGMKILPHFSHVQNGICFLCGGTGKAKLYSWTEGLRADQERVLWEYGHGSSWILITNGKTDSWRGVLDKPRPAMLRWIRSCLDVLKEKPEPSTVFQTAILLAALKDSAYATKRAVAFLGASEAASSLDAAYPSAVLLVSKAREMANSKGFEKNPSLPIPKNPYAVAFTQSKESGGGGRIGFNLPFETAVKLAQQKTEEYGEVCEVIKFDEKEMAWFNKDRTYCDEYN